MSRVLWALALGLALGGPLLQPWSSGLFDVAVAAAGGIFDPNSGDTADGGGIFDPNGGARAGNMFDPDG